MTRNVNAKLVQIDKFKHEQEFIIFDSRYLQIILKSRRKEKDYTIDLRSISPKSISVVHKQWHWLGVMSASGLAFAYFLYSAWHLKVFIYGLWAAGALCTAGLFGVLFFYTMSKKKIFITRFGQVPIVNILANKPDRETVERFVTEIENQAVHAIKNNDLDDEQMRAGEIRMLRRLTNSGILRQEDYDKAKNHVLGSKMILNDN